MCEFLFVLVIDFHSLMVFLLFSSCCHCFVCCVVESMAHAQYLKQENAITYRLTDCFRNALPHLVIVLLKTIDHNCVKLLHFNIQYSYSLIFLFCFRPLNIQYSTNERTDDTILTTPKLIIYKVKWILFILFFLIHLFHLNYNLKIRWWNKLCFLNQGSNSHFFKLKNRNFFRFFLHAHKKKKIIIIIVDCVSLASFCTGAHNKWNNFEKKIWCLIIRSSVN